MKKVVKLTLEKENGDKFVVEFDNVEKIDKYINTLHTMRADLEHKLAMDEVEENEGDANEEEECDCPHCRFMSLVADYLQMPQEEQKEVSFAMLHALLDYLFVETEDSEDEEEEENNDKGDDEKMVIPVKLKNGIKRFITCDDVMFDKKDCTMNYILDGEIVYSIPLSQMAD